MSIAVTACLGMVCWKCDMCNKQLTSKTLSNSFREGQLKKAKFTDDLGQKSNQQINVVISVIIDHTIKSDSDFTFCFLS